MALLLTSLLFVAQPLVWGVHHVLQPHFWCDDHGSFEHRLDGSLSSFESGDADALASGAMFVPAFDDHLCCPQAQQLQKQVRVSTFTGAHCDLPDEPADSPEVVPPHISAPLLSYAPKLPPPIDVAA